MMIDAAVLMSSTDVVRGQKNPLHYGLPARLKTTRVAVELSQRSLATAADLSSTVVMYIERGRAPTLDTVEQLAAALGVTACWLAYGAEGPLPFQQKRPQAEHPAEGPKGAPADAGGALRCKGLPARLGLARALRGLSRKALARAAEMSTTAISNIEVKGSLPNVATAEQLAGVLGVSPCWLAYGEGAGPQETP